MTLLERILILIAIGGIATVSLVAGVAFATTLAHSAYRVVAIFLIVILCSNILAKLTRAYIEA